ncbi:hypothetical protein V2J09_021202 [Rumex salicifolius]
MAGESSNSGSLKVFENHKLAVPASAILYHFGTSAVSVATATGVTHPLDVLKVRLQMQLIGQRGPLSGLGKVFTQMLQKEGPRSFYLGLGPALTRSVLYGGLRLGLYEPTKYVWEIGCGSNNILLKLASGAFAGCFATALTNPVEVLKVRTQMSSDPRGGSIREFHRIISDEGIRALWKGVGPAMARAAALTASQLATYDESKQILLRWMPFQEGFQLHFISSTIAGLVSTLITAPVDMVQDSFDVTTRIWKIRNLQEWISLWLQDDNSVPFFIPMMAFLRKWTKNVVLTEGPQGLYKGGFTLFARLGPQTMITFILCEKLRNLAGLHAI